MQGLKEKLDFRAKSALANPDEISDELLDYALNESEQMCEKRSVAEFARLDLAFVRLKLYLKIELTGEDELLLKNALEVVKNSPFENDAGEQSSARFYKAGVRENEFC